MKTKEQLAKELENVEGWKSLGLTGIFSSPKKKLKKYTEADIKGVADLVTLRRETHEDYYYSVVAFSIKEKLTQEQIEILTERVNEFELGSVRYESTGTGGFYPMVSDEGEYYQDNYEIHRAGEDMDGVYVTVFSDSKPEKLNCPYIIYAHTDHSMYIYYVDQRYL